jgi:hypothetical protein
MKPELVIIALNTALILIAYLYVYPKRAGSDANKIANHDLVASSLSIFIAGSMYWGSGYEFNAILTSLNWFWFALLTYALLEIPFVVWYWKKYNVRVISRT